MSPVLFLATALILNAAANILVKYAAVHPAPARPGWPEFLGVFLHWPFLLGIVCFGLNLLAYTTALRRLPISVAYPTMVSVGYLLILGVSAFLFQEQLHRTQYVGAFLMLGGLWLLVR
jgi:multidrug transporter EmrE-like cation transporter